MDRLNPPPLLRRPSLAVAAAFALLVSSPALRLSAAGAADADPPGAPVSLAGCPRLGSDTAPVTVIEISNFKCSHCRAFHADTFPRLRAQYIEPGKVRWIVLSASDDSSDQYSPIFKIARCIAAQGRYWSMLDELYKVAHRPPSFIEDLVSRNPAIDAEALRVCLQDRATRHAVAEDFASYRKLKLKGTPSFVVWRMGRDGARTEAVISGAEKLEYFQRTLDAMLALP